MPFRPQLSSKAGSVSSRSASPVPSLSGRKSPFQMPSRSATSPFPLRVPSVQLPLPQDSAFPRFPSKLQSSTPTTPVENAVPVAAPIPEDVAPADLYPPASPRDNGGENLLRRMNSIAPGPFHVRGEKEAWKPRHHRKSSSIMSSKDFIRPSSATSSAQGHPRRPSASSSVYTRNTSMTSIPGNFRFTQDEATIPAVPLVPSTIDARLQPAVGKSVSNEQQATAQFDFDSDVQHGSGATQNAPLSRSPPDDANHNSKETPSEPKKPGHKPQVSIAAAMAPLFEIGSTSSFKPSKSIRRHRNAAASVDIQKANALRTVDMGSEPKTGNAPPLPTSSLHKFDLGNPYHTPHESVSSNGSSSSGMKSGSSRSSPPLNESPGPLKSSTTDDRMNRGFQGFDFGVEELPEHDRQNPRHPLLAPQASPDQTIRGFTPEAPSLRPGSRPTTSSGGNAPMPVSQSGFPEISFASLNGYRSDASTHREGPFAPRPLTPARPQGAPLGSPNSQPEVPQTRSQEHDDGYTPLEPIHPPSSPGPPLSVRPVRPLAIVPGQPPQRQNSSPLTSSDEYVVSSFPNQPPNNFHLTPKYPPPPPVPQSTSLPTRRPTQVNKGPCRGCNEPIFGKSVSSADGRLTGRYHKQCFICTTCGIPFQTTDCYVANNHPYCARHYHELNNSICGSCDRGIEGQYLEMLQDPHQRKFHPHCFTCQDCHFILRDDYYEWNGRVLCEQHAFGAASRNTQLPSSLGPGRRFPEKRSTRLMMI